MNLFNFFKNFFFKLYKNEKEDKETTHHPVKNYTEDDLIIMTLTIYGEARSESIDGKIAVGWVIRNRMERKTWYGRTIREVCLKPWQFSCWNDSDPNSKVLNLMHKQIKGEYKENNLALKHINSISYTECYGAAYDVLEGLEEDNTKGSTHYYADYIDSPTWAYNKKPVNIIGHHLFFNNID